MHKVKLMDHTIGDGNPPFIIGELGICHEGDINIALELAAEAIKAGAHCIKTETFNHSSMVFDPQAKASYSIKGKKITVPLIEHMEAYGLTFEEHEKIKKFCDTKGIPFISTAHDFKAIDFLCEIKAAGIKIASPDIVHYPLLRYAASKKLPVFIDTGAALQYEVELALKVLRENGLEDVIFHHNPEGHPAPSENHNLSIINRLKDITGVPIGLSDHYEGYEITYAAAAIGANVIEKPISIDRFDEKPEKNWSISVADLKKVYEIIHSVYQAIGKNERTMSKDSEIYRSRNRMACAAVKDLKKGDSISLENITFGRPRKGIGVEHWDIIDGKKLRRDKSAYEFIQWEDLD